MEWKTTFLAELRSHGLSGMIDKTYDPTFLPDLYKTILHNKQAAFFWTVLLQSFKSPLGIIFVNEHKATNNA